MLYPAELRGHTSGRTVTVPPLRGQSFSVAAGATASFQPLLTMMSDKAVMFRRISVILLVQIAAAIFISLAFNFDYRPQFVDYLTIAFGLWIMTAFARSFYWLWQLWKVKHPAPLQEIGRRLLDPTVPAIYFFVACQFSVLAWLKMAMPYSVGFRTDQMLAAFGHFLLGTDSWRLLQFLPAHLMDTAYVTWAQSTFVLLAILPCLAKSEKRDRALISFFIIVASCALGQYVLPSAGPIFYERIGLGARYAELPTHEWVAVTSDYLWHNFQLRGEGVGIGISAFPSLHVAGAAWVAIVISSYWRALAPLAWVYFTLILLGSVFLGWHYIADGIAGFGIAVIAYRSAMWKLRPATLEGQSPADVDALVSVTERRQSALG